LAIDHLNPNPEDLDKLKDDQDFENFGETWIDGRKIEV
jgi:hypothetical protein